MVEASTKPTSPPNGKTNKSRRKAPRTHRGRKKQPKAQCVACKKTKTACTPAEAKLFRFCSRCNTVSYCSRDCARVHWPDHKPNCKEEHFQHPNKYRQNKAKKKQRDQADKITILSTLQTPSPLTECSSVDASTDVSLASASSASSASDEPSSPNLEVRSLKSLLSLPVRSSSGRWARGPEHPDAVGFGFRKGSTTDDSHDEAMCEVSDPAGVTDSGNESQDEEKTSKALPDPSVITDSESESQHEDTPEAVPDPAGSSQENNRKMDNCGSKSLLSVHAKIFEPEPQLVYTPAFVFVPVWVAPVSSGRGQRRRRKKRSPSGCSPSGLSISNHAVAIR